MIETLSAAEIKTLQSPENEQVKVILPLLLKELVLRGWLNAFQGKRPMHSGWWLFLGATILSLFIHFFVTIVLAIIFLANVVESRSKKTMFALTQRGEAQLQNLGPDAPLLVRILKTVADARPEVYDHCTSKEWRAHLATLYANNSVFHKDLLLWSLENKGLIQMRGEESPQRTSKGDAVLAEVESKIENSRDLPHLIREKSSNVVVMAAQLGGVMLLVPDLQGYYRDFFQQSGNLDMDLGPRPRPTDMGPSIDGGDSGSSFKHSSEKDASDTGDSGNGTDWESNADFLDGDIDAGDGGIGSDGGDGGDGGSGGDSGGDGSGDGGCGGGCGGGGD